MMDVNNNSQELFDDTSAQHAEEDEELPPFALVDSPTDSSSRQYKASALLEASLPKSSFCICSKSTKIAVAPFNDSQNSAPPGLVESVMTDGSSSLQSSSEVHNSDLHTKASPSSQRRRQDAPSINNCFQKMSTSSLYLMSSLQTVHSDVGASTVLSPRHLLHHPHYEEDTSSPTSTSTTSHTHLEQSMQNSDISVASAGFSQLLRAADDTHIQLGLPTTGRMAPVLEDQSEIEESSFDERESGALIVEPIAESPNNYNRNHTVTTGGWLPSLPVWSPARPNNTNELQTPLLSASSIPVSHLLSNNNSNQQFSNTPLGRARDTVKALVEDDQCFEVSMLLNHPCTVEDVMRILANPELLRLWCDPIETLIVTSSSTEESAAKSIKTNGNRINNSPATRWIERQTNNDREREYEGEWIEATTTALGSPPSSVGFLYSVGQTILETLGFASYGRITMFVERRRGHVGLTVGPFHGGVQAFHSITVSEDGNNGGRVKVVDHVRLTRDEDDVSFASFFGGALESCLSRCVLPSVVGYLNQVTTSMARLRVLVENSDISCRNTSIMVVNAPRWK